MKIIIKLSLGVFLALFMMGCTKNFDKINENPNQPAEVGTPTLLTGAMKGLCDDIYDEWWGGRQSMLYAQYWCQRNYTSEDRFAIRQNINNQYWRLIYHDVMNLMEIIRLNTDATTKAKAAVYGDNNNQIAVATILKVWAMQTLTDTWGDIPYSDAFKGNIDPSISEPTPKYDKQQDIYASFLTELKAAVDMIDESASGFTTGDNVYQGDMSLWKKFGNSLRLRVAMRMSAKDGGAAANSILTEVTEAGFMTSNADNAEFPYVGGGSDNAPMYDAFWTSARNDFTTCKTIVNLLKGVDDTLNNKINPFHGLVDPRLSIYSRKKSGKYLGMPYGMTDGQSQAYKGKCPSFYYDLNGAAAYSPATAPVILNPKYAPVYMEYAEVKFMLSELKGFDQTEYVDGVRASIEHWRDICVKLEGWDAAEVNEFNTSIDTFMFYLPAATKQTVLAQKYIAFFNQGYQAWAEYRRTGEPAFLLKPGEIANIDAEGTTIYFNPLISITTIPLRMTYPQQEYTVNGTSVTNAASQLTGGDKMTTKLWWEQ
jgi:hypothetical protein